MATLVGNVNASATSWTVSAAISHDIDYLAIDSETVQILTHTPVRRDPQTLAELPPKISVRRGAGGTTAASHTSGATLTPVILPAAASVGAGSGVTVDNTVDPPAEVATIIAAGAVIAGDEATLGTALVFYGTEDPGAVGAGNIWLRSDGDLRAFFVRNEADDGWLAPQINIYDDLGTRIAELDVNTAGDPVVGDITLFAANSAYTIFGQLSLGADATILSYTNGDNSLEIRFTTAGAVITVGDGVTEAKLRVTAAGVEMEGLPTVNPGVGNKVWNDGGTLKITAPA